MAFLGIGKKDRDGRQVRIEHRGKHLRASRTGDVALREQIRAGGMNLTANTQRGARVSMTPARNTQVAFQNSRFVLRGRYGKGPAKLNLSKSGVSLSTKMGLGTINVTNPGRSSAKIAGIQMRGQKAAIINAVAVLFQLLVTLIRLALALVVFLAVNTLNLAAWFYTTMKQLILSWRFQRQQKQRAERTKQLQEAASQWSVNNCALLNELTPDTCLAALGRLLTLPHHEKSNDSIQKWVDRLAIMDEQEELTDESGFTELPVIGVAILTLHYRESVSSSELPETLYQLDQQVRQDGPRTLGQEKLLEDIADLFGLRLEIQEDG